MAIKINGLTVIDDLQNGTLTGNLSASTVSAVGNISANYFIGNGSQLSGIDATSIQNGTSNVRVTSSGGNVSVGIGGTSNVAVFATNGQYVTGDVSATGNVSGASFTAGNITVGADIISSANATITIDPSAAGATGLVVIAGNLQVTGTTTTIDSTTITTNDLQINMANNAATASAANGGGIGVGPVGTEYAKFTYDSTNTRWNSTISVSVSGNVTGSQFNGSGAGLTSIPGANVTGTVANATYATSAGSATSATTAGTVTTAAQGNITSVGTLTSLSVTGQVTATGVNVPSITHTGTTGVGDIGSTTQKFGTIYGLATSAQYADLAEKYAADAEYEAGTVLVFGGEAEVTLSTTDTSRRVAGVVSTAPAYRMNDSLEGTAAMIALQGRVPCKVLGPVRKGDLMVATADGRARAEENPMIGSVIGKSLEDFDGAEGVIEVAVGRF
jgi:hypothetical protein